MVGDEPDAIAIDADGNLYVVNKFNATISKITPDGTSTVDWGPAGQRVSTGGGYLDGGLIPTAIAIDADGNLYTANSGSNDVTKITPDGVANLNWGPDASAHVQAGAYPVGIVIDPDGNLYVLNGDGATVSKITPDGVSTESWGPSFALVTVAGSPRGIAIDAARNLYTISANIPYARVVSKITPDGTSTVSWSSVLISAPNGIAIDSSGAIYAANENGRAVGLAADAADAADAAGPAPPARPAAPTAVSGNGGWASVTVPENGISAAFGVPSSYTVAAVEDGSKSCVVAPPASSCRVNGLTVGQQYTFTARANLELWQTARSAASGSITAVGILAAPTALVATPGNGSATIAFTPGADNGSAITNYEYSLSGGLWTALSPGDAASPVTITGLTNGTTYSVRLRAINGFGDGKGAASDAVSVKPIKAPAKPVVAWAFSKRARTVTVLIKPVTGVTFKFSAASGAKVKTGTCKSVTVKQGARRVARRSCTVKLAKGVWLVRVTPSKGAVQGAVNSKRYTVK